MKLSPFAYPAVAIAFMAGSVATTTLMALFILFNSVAGDDWVLDHLNAFISAMLSLLIANRIALGVKNPFALATWIAAFAITAILSVTQWFDGYVAQLQDALHIEDLDDVCLWLVTPIGLLAANHFDRIGRLPLRILVAGFLAQSISTGLDLLDGWLTNSVGYDFDLMEVLVDFSEFVFLQFYVVGLTLFVASIYVGAQPVSAPATPGVLDLVLQNLRADLRLLAWQIRHPGQTYGAYYADRITRKLDRGATHSTLGTKDRTRSGVSAVADLSPRERGIGTFGFLRSLGLRPSDRCVDYGCGSLRIGMHLIDYLDRGAYWGVDVTDRFYADGRTLLAPHVEAVKAPRFDVISDDVLSDIRRWQPDVVISVSVLMHVPPAELPAFLGNMFGLLAAGAKAVILFDRTEKNARLSSMSWAYSDTFLRRMVHRIDPALEVTFEYYEPAGHVGTWPVTRHALIASRK